MRKWLVKDYNNPDTIIAAFTVYPNGDITFGKLMDMPKNHIKRIKKFVRDNLKAFDEASSPIDETITVAFINEDKSDFRYIFNEGDLKDYV